MFFFWKFKNRIFLNIGLILDNMERINTKKEHNHHNCYQSVEKTYLNVTDPLIIPMILIFLSCREKAHDNKEFIHQNSKPCRES